MRQLVFVVGIAAGLSLLAGQAAAQYQYTDDKGITKVAQYKLNVPEAYRDAAIWIGLTGQPAVSPPSPVTRAEDVNRRIRDADAQLAPYLRPDAEAKVVEAAAAAARKTRERRDIADAAQAKLDRAEAREEARQDRRDALAEESVRLQRQAVDQLRDRQYWRNR